MLLTLEHWKLTRIKFKEMKVREQLKQVLKDSEISLIESALNAYWHEANKNLENRDELGTIEKRQYDIQKKCCMDLMKKID